VINCDLHWLLDRLNQFTLLEYPHIVSLSCPNLPQHPSVNLLHGPVQGVSVILPPRHHSEMPSECLFICDHDGVLADAKYLKYPQMRTILLEFKARNPLITFAVASANPCSAEYLVRLGLDDIFDTVWSHRCKYPGYKTSVLTCTWAAPASRSKWCPWRSRRRKRNIAVWALDAEEEDIWACAARGEELRNVKEIMVPYLLRHYAHVMVENVVFFDDLTENTQSVERMLGVVGIVVDAKVGLRAEDLEVGLQRIIKGGNAGL
jgi:hypothetical protein